MSDEHKELTRAAKLRAAVGEYFRRQGVNVWRTQQELSADLAPLLNELEYTNAATVYAVIRSMVDNNQLAAKKGDDGMTNLYGLQVGTGRVIEASAALKPAKAKQEAAPAVTVDIVKSTGKVRLTIQGLSIEIGVVEK